MRAHFFFARSSAFLCFADIAIEKRETDVGGNKKNHSGCNISTISQRSAKELSRQSICQMKKISSLVSLTFLSLPTVASVLLILCVPSQRTKHLPNFARNKHTHPPTHKHTLTDTARKKKEKKQGQETLAAISTVGETRRAEKKKRRNKGILSSQRNSLLLFLCLFFLSVFWVSSFH